MGFQIYIKKPNIWLIGIILAIACIVPTFCSSSSSAVTPTKNIQIPTCNVPRDKLQSATENLIDQDHFSLLSSRISIAENGKLWPKGEVHFTMDPSLSYAKVQMIYEAFSEFHQKTCIRFKPWNKNHTKSENYITIKNDPSACSLSEVCMKGGQQFIQIGGLCWFKEMIIHQLAHALCLGHEHQRSIRDDYLSYSHTCTEKDIPHKNDKDNQLGFYDYASQMHFACGWCSGGWPKRDNVTECGYQVTKGLSLLDADYINLLYGCGGCNRHRWLPLTHLLNAHKEWMYNFKYRDRLGYSLYPCRVNHDGEIIIGKFTWAQKICSFSLGGKEYYQTGEGTEVLLLPGGPKSKDGMSEYKVEPVTAYSDEKILKIGVAAGRLTEREEYGLGYVAFGTMVSPETNSREQTIGKTWERDGKLPYAYFPLGGKEVVAHNFHLLTCHYYSNTK